MDGFYGMWIISQKAVKKKVMASRNWSLTSYIHQRSAESGSTEYPTTRILHSLLSLHSKHTEQDPYNPAYTMLISSPNPVHSDNLLTKNPLPFQNLTTVLLNSSF